MQDKVISGAVAVEVVAYLRRGDTEDSTMAILLNLGGRPIDKINYAVALVNNILIVLFPTPVVDVFFFLYQGDCVVKLCYFLCLAFMARLRLGVIDFFLSDGSDFSKPSSFSSEADPSAAPG